MQKGRIGSKHNPNEGGKEGVRSGLAIVIWAALTIGHRRRRRRQG